MTKDYLLSVVIPAYNAQCFLQRAVKSILAQKYSELIQVIVVDDGSKDKTLEVAENLARKYSQVTVIHQENQGVGTARNTGIDNAKGKYIAFCDSDDWWDENFVDEELIKELDDGATDIFEFSFKHVTNRYDYEKIYKIDDADMEYTENGLSHYNYSFLWRHIFKVSLVKNNYIRFGKSKSGEDILFTEQCYFLSRNTKSKSKIMYCYYKNSNSVMHTGASETFLGSFCGLTERYEWLKKYGVNTQKDCDYHRLLTARRYLIAVCKENCYFATKKIICKCKECGILKRYKEFSPPQKEQKEIELWDKHPFVLWFKCKILYKFKDNIAIIGYRHKFFGKIIDSVVYPRRGYTKIPQNRKEKYQNEII